MTAQVQSSEKQETQILITIQHGNSMLDFENNLQFSLNQAGMLGVEKQLEYMDTDGSPIKVRGVQMTSKSKKEPKVYETSWGAINVSRHIYQSSHGGETFCPLDQSARIIVNSTPAFARMVSWKYAQMAAPQVEEDLRQHHGRKSSRSTLRDLADVVASIAQAKEDKWEYDIPELSKPVATVAIGLDGANLLYYEGYRIAMCGTISLYDDEGERLHTIYCAEAPEYGKQSFINRFTGEIQKVKEKFPNAVFKNHWHQMIYPEARDKHLPIGSGVTEAACKSLVKQRLCRSGMRWKEQGASMLLTLRALVCTPGQWDAFWSKMSRYGFPVVHNLIPTH